MNYVLLFGSLAVVGGWLFNLGKLASDLLSLPVAELGVVQVIRALGLFNLWLGGLIGWLV